MNQGFDKETFKKAVIYNVKNLFRKTVEDATKEQMFQAVSYAVKDVIIDEWIATHKTYEKEDVKTVYYLSMEFLMAAPWATILLISVRRRKSKKY